MVKDPDCGTDGAVLRNCLPADCPLLGCPATNVCRDGINPQTLTEDLLQVGQGGHTVVRGPAVRLRELSLYFPEEFLLDLRVGGQ